MAGVVERPDDLLHRLDRQYRANRFRNGNGRVIINDVHPGLDHCQHFRWNGRKFSDTKRRDEAVKGAEGKRLFYKTPTNAIDGI